MQCRKGRLAIARRSVYLAKILGAYLQLIRPPNLFTAAADIVAGFLFVGGGWGEIDRVILLSLCSMCLYAAGVTLNDVCDVRNDRAERPDRPIPAWVRSSIGLPATTVFQKWRGWPPAIPFS